MLASGCPSIGAPMPTVSVKELAEVVAAASPRERRKVVEQIRRRRGKGGPPPFYASAKSVIRRFHKEGHSQDWLEGEVSNMRRDARHAVGWRRDDLARSATALDSYRLHFGRRVLTIDTAPRLGIVCRGVRVTSSPDLVAREQGVLRFLRLELREEPLSQALVEIAPVVLFSAAAQYGFPVQPSDVELIFVRQGQVFVAQDVSRIMGMVERTCTEIRGCW